MDYKKKDGTLVSEQWMDGIADAADADALRDTVIAVEDNVEYDGDIVTIPVSFSRPCLDAIEKAAERAGESRTDFIRNAVNKALLTA